eukprot:381922-Rhodomonas_salina.5
MPFALSGTALVSVVAFRLLPTPSLYCPILTSRITYAQSGSDLAYHLRLPYAQSGTNFAYGATRRHAMEPQRCAAAGRGAEGRGGGRGGSEGERPRAYGGRTVRVCSYGTAPPLRYCATAYSCPLCGTALERMQYGRYAAKRALGGVRYSARGMGLAAYGRGSRRCVRAYWPTASRYQPTAYAHICLGLLYLATHISVPAYCIFLHTSVSQRPVLFYAQCVRYWHRCPYTLPAYGFPMRCQDGESASAGAMLEVAIVLRISYAMPGTDMLYRPTDPLCDDTAYRPTDAQCDLRVLTKCVLLHGARYWLCMLRYAFATRCRVLTQRMLLPGTARECYADPRKSAISLRACYAMSGLT